MWEYEIIFPNGNHDLIQGYNYEDALRRSGLVDEQIKDVLYFEYID